MDAKERVQKITDAMCGIMADYGIEYVQFTETIPNGTMVVTIREPHMWGEERPKIQKPHYGYIIEQREVHL